MTLDELIEALEQAAGPKFGLDSWLAFHATGEGSEVKPFTASLDAAMTLVPEDYDWSLHVDNGAAVAGCEPTKEDGCTWADCAGATPAIALCIAALKARRAAA